MYQNYESRFNLCVVIKMLTENLEGKVVFSSGYLFDSKDDLKVDDRM